MVKCRPGGGTSREFRHDRVPAKLVPSSEVAPPPPPPPPARRDADLRLQSQIKANRLKGQISLNLKES